MKIICDCGKEAFDTNIPGLSTFHVDPSTRHYGMFVDTKGYQPEDFPDAKQFVHILIECVDPECGRIPLFVGWKRKDGE